MKASPLIDFHAHLWRWPDHLTDEFVDAWRLDDLDPPGSRRDAGRR